MSPNSASHDVENQHVETTVEGSRDCLSGTANDINAELGNVDWWEYAGNSASFDAETTSSHLGEVEGEVTYQEPQGL